MEIDKLIQIINELRDIMITVSTTDLPLKQYEGEYRTIYQKVDTELKLKGMENPNPHSDIRKWHGKWSSGDLPTYKIRREHIRNMYNLLLNNLTHMQSDKNSKPDNLDNYKIDDGYQDIAEVCVRGHLINENIIKNPKNRQKYCGECGSKTITACPNCKEPIPGRFIYYNFEDTTVWGPPENFCRNCANPFPWIEKKLEINKSGEKIFDAFLSHSNEDNESISDELYNSLKRNNLSVWYDKKIKENESIPGEINDGIVSSKNGIIVFSNNYKKSLPCKVELHSMQYRSTKYEEFKLFIVLYEFSFDDFQNDYPTLAYKKIFFSHEGVISIAKRIADILKEENTAQKEFYQHEENIKEDYIKVYTNLILEFYDYETDKNHLLNNHSKEIIIENKKSFPITITKITFETDVPLFYKSFNSNALIRLNATDYSFSSTGKVELFFNQNPLILSPKATLSLLLSLLTTSNIKYNDKYSFNYSININEAMEAIVGTLIVKTQLRDKD